MRFRFEQQRIPIIVIMLNKRSDQQLIHAYCDKYLAFLDYDNYTSGLSNISQTQVINTPYSRGAYHILRRTTTLCNLAKSVSWLCWRLHWYCLSKPRPYNVSFLCPRSWLVVIIFESKMLTFKECTWGEYLIVYAPSVTLSNLERMAVCYYSKGKEEFRNGRLIKRGFIISEINLSKVVMKEHYSQFKLTGLNLSRSIIVSQCWHFACLCNSFWWNMRLIYIYS